MKKMILIGTLLVSFNTLQAESITGAISGVVKEKINADKEVAIANINKGTEVTVSNSTINIKTKLKDGAIIGNTGLVAIGEKVELDNVEMVLNTDVKESLLLGNSGVVLGGK